MGLIGKILRKFTKQDAVLWKKVDSGPGGEAVYDTPVQVKCRWEDRDEEVELADGRTVRAQGYVLMGVKPPLGSLLFEGTAADWHALPSYPDPPSKAEGGCSVQKANRTPDLKGTEFLFEVWV